MNIYKKKKNENESRHEKDQLEIHGFTSSHHLISLLAFSKSGPCIPLEFFIIFALNSKHTSRHDRLFSHELIEKEKNASEKKGR